MRLHLAAVGRMKNPAFSAAAEDYAGRLGHYASLQIREVKDARGKEDPDHRRTQESRALLEACPKSAYLVVLDERGTQVTSTELAARLDAEATRGNSEWVFVLGGPNGLDDEIRKAARWTWALGKLTLPHELARVVVLEQLYRAFTILRGEAYHRE